MRDQDLDYSEYNCPKMNSTHSDIMVKEEYMARFDYKPDPLRSWSNEGLGPDESPQSYSYDSGLCLIILWLYIVLKIR